MFSPALIAAWVLLASPAKDSMSPYRGLTVLSIELEAPEDEDKTYLRSLIAIEKGFLVSAEDVQTSIKRLYALGRFSNVTVDAQRVSGVVNLRFTVTPRVLLEKISVEGLQRIGKAKLLGALRFSRGSEVDQSLTQRVEARAIAFLERSGLPKAKVTVVVEPTDGGRAADLRLKVDEGPPKLVSSVQFTGRRRVPVLALSQVVEVRPDTLLNLNQLAEDRKRLEKAYVRRGFLLVKVSDPVVSDGPEGIVVRHIIDAGDRVKIEFVGNQRVTEKTLMTLWPETSAQIQTMSLTSFGERIEDRYRRSGFAEAKVEIRGFVDRERRIRKYIVKITEGAPIYLKSIRFDGAQAFKADVLAEQVRAIMAKELHRPDDFEQLSKTEVRVAETSRQSATPVANAPSLVSPVPAEERWVRGAFDNAMNDIGSIYRDRGYLSFTADAPVIVKENNTIAVTIRISEGIQTRVDQIAFRGNEVLLATDALEEIESRTGTQKGTTKIIPGAPFSASAIEDGRIALIRRYRDMGHIYARVFADWTITEDQTKASVTYRFEEGPQVRLRTVLTRGNRYTQTDTIMSRISLKEGDLYRLEQAVRDQRAVANLGVFSSVRVKLIDEERPEELKDLVAEVSEQNRHAIEAFAGMSTAEGLRGGLTYTHRNLFGNATSFTASTRFNRQVFFGLYGQFESTMRRRYRAWEETFGDWTSKALERDIRLSLASRRLDILPVPTSYSFSLHNERKNAIPFSLDTTAAAVGVEFFPTNRITVEFKPEFALTGLECPNDDARGQCISDAQLSQDRRRFIDAGLRQTLKIGPRIVIDERDDAFAPRSGFWADARFSYAVGRLRPEGENEFRPFSFAKLEAGIVGYIPLLAPTLVLTLRAGTLLVLTGDGVPVDERFYLGGRESLRGYVEDTVIPEDVCVWTPGQTPSDPSAFAAKQEAEGCSEVLQVDNSGDPPVTRGGNTYLLTRAELRIPVTDSVSFDLFVDAGNLWVGLPTSDNLRPRFGTGVGLRYNTAVGSLVLDIGFNPSPRPVNGEQTLPPQYHISLSTF